MNKHFAKCESAFPYDRFRMCFDQPQERCAAACLSPSETARAISAKSVSILSVAVCLFDLTLKLSVKVSRNCFQFSGSDSSKKFTTASVKSS